MPERVSAGASLPELRTMLAHTAKSRSSRSSRSSRDRITRIRKFISTINLYHILQLSLAVYLLTFLHIYVGKSANAEYAVHPGPSGEKMHVRVPKHFPIKRLKRALSPRKLLNTTNWPYSYSRPPTVIGFSVQGGVGNQIYNILEALYLARQIRAVLLLPAVLPRTDTGEGDTGENDVRLGSTVWDMGELTRGTKGRPVFPYLPASCRGRIDVMYTVLRRNNPVPEVNTVPSEVRWGACALLMAARRSEAPDCDRIFAHTTVEVRRQNLTIGGDDSFIREMRTLRRMPFPNKSPEEPLCVWIHGHSYDRGGVSGDEYLYSHMHFLRTHARIRAAAQRWPLDALTVVHVRYDEELCDVRSHGPAYVCIRAHKDGKRRDPVFWAPLALFVGRISDAVEARGVRSIYLAASPYVPAATEQAIRAAFAKRLRVVLHASAVFDDETDINFLERELAIQAKIFIGDFASTWSGTVHYKRRTLGKVSHWANSLLDVATNIGYYDRTEPLQIPD